MVHTYSLSTEDRHDFETSLDFISQASVDDKIRHLSQEDMEEKQELGA